LEKVSKNMSKKGRQVVVLLKKGRQKFSGRQYGPPYLNTPLVITSLFTIDEIEVALTLHPKCRSSTAKLANLVEF
jgi:hypothetical protein